MLLNTPLRIGSKTIKNRIVIPPMMTFGFGAPAAGVSERHLSHYALLGKGGAGLLIVEASTVSGLVPPSRNCVDLWDDRFIPGLSALAKVCKQDGSVALVQMMHRGFDGYEDPAASDIPEELLVRIPKAYAEAGLRCKQAGFDGVELHGAHGFFLCKLIASGRADIAAKGIEAVHAACGEDFIVGIRTSCAEPDYAAALRNAKLFEQSGADYLSISSGVAPVPAPPEGFAYSDTIYGASLVHDSVGIPVFCVKNVRTGEQAEGILQAGYADGVCIGKGALADPDWANKALREEAVATCLDCKDCKWFVDGHDCPRRVQLGLQV